MEAMGKVNRYVCEKCKAVHGTINLNSGTTPFLIGCKSCDGMAQSSFYRLPEGEAGCGWAWYRPIPSVFERLTAGEQEHILAGGLILGDLESVISLTETDEVFEMLSGRDCDRWLCYVVAAYKPEAEMLNRVAERFGPT